MTTQTVVNYVIQGRVLKKASGWVQYDIAPDSDADGKATLETWQASRDARGALTQFRVIKRTAVVTDEIIFTEAAE